MLNHSRYTSICIFSILLFSFLIISDPVRASRSNRNCQKFVQNAKENVKSGNFKEARQDIRAALAIQPRNEENLYFGALIDYKMGKSASAVMKCEKILANNRARRYRNKAVKLKRLAMDNINNRSRTTSKVLRASSITMLYSEAMKNQKYFVDSGYSNVVKRVEAARRHSLSPVNRKTITKTSAYDILTGKKVLSPAIDTNQYAKATNITNDEADAAFSDKDNHNKSELNVNNSAATMQLEETENDTVTFELSENNDDNQETSFDDFNNNTSKTPEDNQATIAEHMKPVETNKPKETNQPTQTVDTADDGSGFGDFGDFEDDSSSEKANNTPPTKTVKVVKEPATIEVESDSDFGGFGDFEDDSQSANNTTPTKTVPKVVKATNKKTTTAKGKTPPVVNKKATEESDDFGGFGDFGDATDEEKEKAESNDDASDGFGDFGDDNDSSSSGDNETTKDEDEDEDFGGFEGF